MSNRTNSLFHYTQELDTLLAIIESGIIYPNFCKEDLSTSRNPNYILGIPEICFCDLPISKASIYLEHYGHYAIAFTKEWGIEKGCNPVLYVSNESIIDGAIHYKERTREGHKQLTNKVAIQGLSFNFDEFIQYLEDQRAYMYSLGFYKKYMGEWKDFPYCNYKENEWRYIIEDGFHDIFWMNYDEYKKWRGKEYKLVDNKKITIPKPSPSNELKKLGLQFNIDVINHILIDKESERNSFIEKLSSIKTIGGCCITTEKKNQLISKVNSFEEIKQDY